MTKRIALLLFCAVGLIFQPGTAKADAFGPAGGREYVYVETNIKTPNGNSIAAFVRGANGQLTEIPGSPFFTGGSGVQYSDLNVGPLDSDQDIAIDDERNLLYAVNSGSDSIAVFRIQDNGALKAIEGSPFASGGNNPVSLALSGDTLFVVNKSGDFGRPTGLLPNYTALRVQRDGSLVPTGDTANDTSHVFQSKVEVAIGSSPTQAFVAPGTSLLFGTDFLTGLVQRFKFDSDGGLHQFAPLSLPASEFGDMTTPRLPLGLWSHPNRPILYVGFVTASKLGVYRYGPDGSLKFLRAAPNQGKAICWIRTNRPGTRLYTTNTVTNSVSVYDVSDAENPVQIQEFPLSGVGNVLQFSLSVDEQYLYALSTRGTASIPEGQGNVLHVLQIQGDGRVLETANPINFHLPPGTRPQGVAVVSIR